MQLKRNKKAEKEKEIMILITYIIGGFIILNIILGGYPLLIALGGLEELKKHDTVARKEMLSYLSKKYNESFEVLKLESPFLDTRYFGVVVPTASKLEIFTVVGTPVEAEDHNYQYVDNYMGIKWKQEADQKLKNILKNDLSTHLYGEIDMPVWTDYAEYNNTNLSLQEFQKAYPDVLKISLVLVYPVQQGKEKKYMSDIDQFIALVKKSGIKDITLKLYVVNANILRTTKEFNEVIEKLGIYAFLHEYNFGIITEKTIDLDRRTHF